MRRVTEPFYVVCGAGTTGTLIARGLADLNRRFVIVERDELRVQELDLEDLATNPLLIEGDAALPETLLRAGLRHPQYRGVLAVTNDDQANLAIAIAARLFNPRHPVLARTTDPQVALNMESFGTDHVINPFQQFAEELALSIAHPDRYRLIEVLTALPGGAVPEVHRPPRGRWVVCGHGRFGQEVVSSLQRVEIEVTVIDPLLSQDEVAGLARQGVHAQIGRGTEADSLVGAGILDAVGIVAGSDVDANNLSIAITASQLNSDVFVVCRQNETANDLLFDAFESDFEMVSTRVVAEECLAIITTPLLSQFVREVRRRPEGWCADLAAHLQTLGEGRVPEVWGLTVDADGAAAVHASLARGEQVQLRHLLRDSADRDDDLAVLALMLAREGELDPLPGPDTLLRVGDRLLFAGDERAARRQQLTAENLNALDYVRFGHELSSGWLWRRLTGSGRR